jgi:hypothetical protein
MLRKNAVNMPPGDALDSPVPAPAPPHEIHTSHGRLHQHTTLAMCTRASANAASESLNALVTHPHTLCLNRGPLPLRADLWERAGLRYRSKNVALHYEATI